MANPIGIMFALGSRMRDIRRIMALYKKNKKDNTEMVDLMRDIADDVGLLDPMKDALAVPEPLR